MLLKEVTARVFRFMKNLKDQTAGKEQTVANRELCPEELDNAEHHWIQHISRSHLHVSFNIYREITNVQHPFTCSSLDCL